LELTKDVMCVVFDKTGVSEHLILIVIPDQISQVSSSTFQQTLTRGEMAVKDILLLSDCMTGESNVARDVGVLIDKANCCDSDDPSSRVKLVLKACRAAIETLLYFAACAEQSSEHPIAKGKLIDDALWNLSCILNLKHLTLLLL
jgi:cation transport ATPase